MKCFACNGEDYDGDEYYLCETHAPQNGMEIHIRDQIIAAQEKILDILVKEFEDNGWTWWSGKPDRKELKRTLLKLVEETYTKKLEFMSTGRILILSGGFVFLERDTFRLEQIWPRKDVPSQPWKTGWMI